MIALIAAAYAVIGVSAAIAATYMICAYGRVWHQQSVSVVWAGLIGALAGAAWPLLFSVIVGMVLRESILDLIGDEIDG